MLGTGSWNEDSYASSIGTSSTRNLLLPIVVHSALAACPRGSFTQLFALASVYFSHFLSPVSRIDTCYLAGWPFGYGNMTKDVDFVKYVFITDIPPFEPELAILCSTKMILPSLYEEVFPKSPGTPRR